MSDLKGFSKFTGSVDLINKVVDVKKVTVSTTAQILLTPTKDKFTLNDKAMELLDLKIGDKIDILDLNKGVTEPSELETDDNNRFLIAKNIYDVSSKKGKIGDHNSFSYVGAYSAILAGVPNKTALTVKELIGLGVTVERVTTGKDGKSHTSYIATKKVACDIVLVGESIISKDENADTQPIYGLTNLVRTTYTPQEIKDVKAESTTNEETE
jgi:hypothetical protein